MISREDALANCKSKQHYYDRMVALDWDLPDVDSRICTKDFMRLVREKKLYCLKSAEVRKKNVTRIRHVPTQVLQGVLIQHVAAMVSVELDEDETEE